YIAAAADAPATHIRVGSAAGSLGGVGNPSYTTETLKMGRWATSVVHLTGTIDDVRISSVDRSADWLEYAYADDFSNEDTFELGPEEVDGGGGSDEITETASGGVVCGGIAALSCIYVTNLSGGVLTNGESLFGKVY